MKSASGPNGHSVPFFAAQTISEMNALFSDV